MANDPVSSDPAHPAQPEAAASEPVAAPAPSLTQRVGPAARWVGLGFGFNLLIRFGSNLLLTRLLAPEMYGVMAIGNVIVGAVYLLSDMGLGLSLIQNPRSEEPRFLNTLWTLQVVRGVLMGLVMLLLAGLIGGMNALDLPWLSGAYRDPALPMVVVILSLVPVLTGFESTSLGMARRRLDYKRVVTIELVSQLVATAAGFIMAWLWPSPWVLPLNWVILTACSIGLSHWRTGQARNFFVWDESCVREAWGFAKWVMLSSSLTFLVREGDRLVLGALVGSAALGAYSLGAMLAGTVQGVVYRLAAAVGMPALAEVARDRPERLAHAYRRCRWPLDLVCLSTAGFLCTGAWAVVGLLFDGRYQDAALPLSILSLGMLGSRYTVFDQYLLAVGDTKKLFQRNVYQVVFFYLSVPLAFHLAGMVGALVAITLSQFASLPIVMRVKAQRGLLDVRYELRVLPIFLAAAAAGWLFSALMR